MQPPIALQKANRNFPHFEPWTFSTVNCSNSTVSKPFDYKKRNLSIISNIQFYVTEPLKQRTSAMITCVIFPLIFPNLLSLGSPAFNVTIICHSFVWNRYRNVYFFAQCGCEFFKHSLARIYTNLAPPLTAIDRGGVDVLWTRWPLPRGCSHEYTNCIREKILAILNFDFLLIKAIRITCIVVICILYLIFFLVSYFLLPSK